MKRKAFSALPLAKIRFIEPMYARLVQKLPEGNEWLRSQARRLPLSCWRVFDRGRAVGPSRDSNSPVASYFNAPAPSVVTIGES